MIWKKENSIALKTGCHSRSPPLPNAVAQSLLMNQSTAMVGWSRDKSHSSGWSDSAVFGSPFYTRPLLIAENNECKMNLAMKISHFVRCSVLCHQGRNWIFSYFSNFLTTKYSGVLNKYLLNGTSPVLKNGNLSSLDSSLIPFNSV